MELGTLLGASWAPGINAYLTVLVLGVSGRLGWADTPESLHRPMVLIPAAVMFLIEFVVDKVPYLDNLWDVVHTVIRPSVAAALSTTMASVSLNRPTAMALAAGLALTGHSLKATGRLAINLSPEPFTNIITSLGEDGLVGVVVALAMAYPVAAGGIAVVLAIISVVVVVILWKVARRGWRALRHRKERPRGVPIASPGSVR